VAVVGALRKLVDVSVLAESLDPADETAAADAFLADAQRYRRELLAHCYRMTGSVHDAEDLVQDTYLRRPLPSGLGQPASDPTGDITEHREITWLEPLPDSPKEDPADPSVIVESRESVRLAFIAAIQHLSARQRAVLVLREVLQWKAAEVGEAIGASTAAVNSLLQRARAQLDAVQPAQDDEVAVPESPEAKDQLAKYMAAFEEYDMDKLVALFTEDAVFEMPPFDGWYQGPANIVALSKKHCPAEGPGDMRFVPITANDQPAAALYMLNRETGLHEEFQMHVLEVRSGGISHVVAFHAGDGLFESFGLPAALNA
jgi:RNA polymerase sigma-70 factor, ECF subfamily